MRLPVVARGCLWLSVSLVLLACVACSGEKRKLYPVRGKVLFDGKPAEGALVTLQALDNSSQMSAYPRAQVKPDGSFSIATYQLEDGAQPGDYKVVIMWMPENARQLLMEGKLLVNKLPPQYADAKTTPLEVHVKEGPNDLSPFELQAPGKARP